MCNGMATVCSSRAREFTSTLARYIVGHTLPPHKLRLTSLSRLPQRQPGTLSRSHAEDQGPRLQRNFRLFLLGYLQRITGCARFFGMEGVGTFP